MPKGKVAALALFAIVVGVVLWMNARTTPPADPSDRPARLAVTEAPTVTPPVTIPEPAPVVTGDPHAEQVARDAVTAWQVQDVPARQAALAPLVLPELLDLYAYTDPMDVPQAPVASATTVEYGEGSMTLDVALADGTRLVVIVDDVYADGQYRVTAINPAE